MDISWPHKTESPLDKWIWGDSPPQPYTLGRPSLHQLFKGACHQNPDLNLFVKQAWESSHPSCLLSLVSFDGQSGEGVKSLQVARRQGSCSLGKHKRLLNRPRRYGHGDQLSQVPLNYCSFNVIQGTFCPEQNGTVSNLQPKRTLTDTPLLPCQKFCPGYIASTLTKIIQSQFLTL